jgi:hypothetical protein
VFWWLFQPFWAQASYSVPYSFFTDSRTPWANYQPVARPLPKHRTTQTQNKHIHTQNIHALSGIRTHDLRARTSEDSSCLRLGGYWDRHSHKYTLPKIDGNSWITLYTPFGRHKNKVFFYLLCYVTEEVANTLNGQILLSSKRKPQIQSTKKPM